MARILKLIFAAFLNLRRGALRGHPHTLRFCATAERARARFGPPPRARNSALCTRAKAYERRSKPGSRRKKFTWWYCGRLKWSLQWSFSTGKMFFRARLLAQHLVMPWYPCFHRGASTPILARFSIVIAQKAGLVKFSIDNLFSFVFV